MEPRKTAAGSGYTNIFPLYLLVFKFNGIESCEI